MSKAVLQGQNTDKEYMYEDEGISLKELLLVLIKGKKIIISVTAILLILVLCFSVIVPNIEIGTKGQVQTAVKIYFDGIDKGLKPDGTEFDPSEIKAPQILKRAALQLPGNKKISASFLSENIHITEVISDKAAQTLQNISGLKSEDLKFQKLEELSVYPDTFILSLDIDNKLGLSLEEGRQLLDYVVYEYRKWLTEEYENYSVLSNLFTEDFDISKYDYIQAVDLLSSELDVAKAYVEGSIADENFVSKRTGKSKEDLLNNIQSIKEVNIEFLYTKIAMNYLTKDMGRSAAIYEKLAENKDVIAAQKYEEASAVAGLIQTYKKNDKITVLGNGMQEPFELKQGDATYDKLVERYVAAKSSSSAAAADAAYYRNEASRFSQITTANKDEKLIKETESLIAAAVKKAKIEIDSINHTVKDYYNQATYEKYVEQLLPAQDYHKQSSVNIPLNLAIALAAGLILGILIVLFREYLGDENEK